MGGRPSERIAIQSLTINNTICAYLLSQSHCECRGMVGFTFAYALRRMEMPMPG